MTIFLTLLKLLIKNRLSVQIAKLIVKSRDPRYKKQLCLDQKEILENLDKYITGFNGTMVEMQDLDRIMEEIGLYRKQIQAKRSDFNEPRDSGETIACVSNLMFHAQDFYDKLKEFLLLNKVNNETSPLGIVYFHAAYYLGEELFDPLPNSDQPIREKKEQIIKTRLQLLLRNLTNAKSLIEQIERTLEVLDILLSDNVEIKNPKENHSTGFFSSSNLINLVGQTIKTSLGLGSDRFQAQFGMAQSKIRLMQEKLLETYKQEFKNSPFVEITQEQRLALDKAFLSRISLLPVPVASAPSVESKEVEEKKAQQPQEPGEEDRGQDQDDDPLDFSEGALTRRLFS